MGRSLRYIAFNFATVDLIKLCHEVLRTMEPLERHCASVAGKTYLIRIAPYATLENKKKDEHNRSMERLRGLVLTFVDTTKQVDDQAQIDEMAKALRAAVRSGKEKESFLSYMSHDMRTPMTAIFGLTQLSLQEKSLPDTVRDNLEKVMTSSEYLLSLIEEVLETSSINAGKVVSLATAVREEDVLNTVTSIIEEQTHAADLSFEPVITGSKNRYVLMDVPHVERILMNLLSNAAKFTPRNGKVWFGTRVEYRNDFAVHTYTVRDNGIGISESFQNRMFLPFEQERNEEELSHGGTGLGLYIVKNLVDLLGGTLECKSSPGEGTEFTVRLEYALATEEQVAMQSHRSASFEDQVLYGKTVLLAEDNQINAEVIIKVLNTKGIHVELARDGEEALEMYQAKGAYHYQAILMDLMMPVKDGFAAAEAIRRLSLPDASGIPIIALTAAVSDRVEKRCEEVGIDFVVSKPIDQGKLFQFLAMAFENNL